MMLKAMKNKMAIVSLFALSVIAPAAIAESDEEKARLDSTDRIQSLDLLIAQQMANEKIKTAKQAKSILNSNLLPNTLSDHLSLRKQSDRNSKGVFYLRDLSDGTPVEHASLGGRPNFSSLIAPVQDMFGQGSQRVVSSSSRIGVNFATPQELEDGPHGFEVALQSGYSVARNLLMDNQDPAMMDQQFNLGLSLGYSGFNVDANIVQQTNALSSDYSGYDVGFSYRTNNFWTRLSLTQLSQEQDLFNIKPNNNITSLELGAGYRISRRFSLTGGLRYSGYDQKGLAEDSSTERAQMVFLGTRLDF